MKPAPKYVFSSIRCPGMQEAILEHVLNTNEWTERVGAADPADNFERGARLLEWPADSRQMVWYTASYDGQETLVNAYGLAYPA